MESALRGTALMWDLKSDGITSVSGTRSRITFYAKAERFSNYKSFSVIATSRTLKQLMVTSSVAMKRTLRRTDDERLIRELRESF